MRIFVSVTDPLHRFVTGLGVDDFNVTENGIRQRISRFNGEEAPVAVWIVWDVRPYAQEIVSLRSLLTEKLAIYEPEHPDIQRRRQQIATLEQSSPSLPGDELKKALSDRNPGDAYFLIPVDTETLRTAGEEIKKDTNARMAVAVVLSQDHQSEL